ncbi:MAG: endoflagellar protein [Calditrichaeota bacterium]|nr:MAG: endoflagellar protein [Calditrichota bacterium]
MITVTRINNSPITINAELIEFIEATPDTIITTMTGKKIIVKDSVDEVVEKIVSYRQRCFENIRVKLEKQPL